jgi:hypothetical protein
MSKVAQDIWREIKKQAGTDDPMTGTIMYARQAADRGNFQEAMSELEGHIHDLEYLTQTQDQHREVRLKHLQLAILELEYIREIAPMPR